MNQTRAVLDDARWGHYYRPGHAVDDQGLHLREAADWLCRAQDAGGDRGVSYGARFGGTFEPSYPETTGYIIPTFLALERHFEEPSYRQRAIDAALWEVDIQMPTGAVMAGSFNLNPKPAIFNTGQVLIGWAALGRVAPDARIARAAQAASAWMLSMQEPDGRWLRGNSPHADPESTVYNVQAAWGLCEAGVLWNWPPVVAASLRNAEYCLTNQQPNGWFRNCCLSDASRPLLHTLAYTVQGLLGIGLLTGRKDVLDGAIKTADVLAQRVAHDGFLPGRFSADWSGAVPWCCLTGSAQMSNVWSDLYHLTGEDRYRNARDLVNRYLVARHDVTHRNPAIRGGVPGSWPTSGAYGRYKILNWATKYFVDALLSQRGPRRPNLYADALVAGRGSA